MSAEAARDVVDGAALERLFGIGGREFLLEMIELFLEHAPQRLALARASHDVGDFTTVYRAAHSLKSTAANLGARLLQETAARVEELAAAEDAEAIAPLLDELEGRYAQVRSDLEAERDRRNGAGT